MPSSATPRPARHPDIHLNQANVGGAHAEDNGTLHDGGLLLSTVYLERADQPGRLRPGPRSRRHRQLCDHQPVAAWVAADRPQRPRDEVDAEIPGGASTIVVLDGTGVQLGSNGGNLVLQDALAHQVDSVTSSAKDAATVDRYIRFQQ